MDHSQIVNARGHIAVAFLLIGTVRFVSGVTYNYTYLASTEFVSVLSIELIGGVALFVLEALVMETFCWSI